MFLKKILFIFLALTLPLLAMAQQDSVLTLQRCVDLAIKNNLDVRRSETQMERDRIYWKQARENLLPNLNANFSYGLSYGRAQNASGVIVDAARTTSVGGNISSNVILSNGLSYINAIKQNALAYQAGKLDFQQLKDETTLNVIALYFAALNSEDQLTQANLQFAGSKSNLERETILNNAGNVAPADYYNIKGTNNTDQINIYNAQTAVLTAKINLLEALNVPFSKNIGLERLKADKTPAAYLQRPDEIYNAALNSLALVKAADYRVRAAEKGVQVAKGRLFPTLSLGGNYQTGYQSNSDGSFSAQIRQNKYYGPSLSLSIPILNYFQYRNNVTLAKLDLRDAQNVNTTTQVQLKQQIEQAHANMTNAYDRLQVLTQQVDTYTSAYTATKAKFDAGVITSDLFIISKNNLDAANVNLINARYDFVIRTKILDYYQGKLTL